MSLTATAPTALPVPWGLTDEQHEFVQAIRDFVRREAPTSAERTAIFDPGGEVRREELLGKVADLGWMGVGLPEEYGGSGGGVFDMCLFTEEIGRVLPLVGPMVSHVVAHVYLHFGTEEQKADIIGGICHGRPEAIAISEPAAGSDVGNLSCRAEPVDGGFVINGQKTWISNAHASDHILLICRTDPNGAKFDGVSMISVPTDAEGLEIRGIDTMVGKEVNDVFFSDVFADAGQVVGEAGQGWVQLMAGFNVERVLVGAVGVGMAIRALEEVLVYVNEREQFGRKIGSFQVQKHRIAELATEIACTRAFVHEVARRVDAEPERMLAREASMVKLKASELAKRVSLECQAMMGGYGYATEYGMEMQVRQALGMIFGGGTSDIHRETIAKTFGL